MIISVCLLITRDLNYDRYIDIGKESITESNDYNSHNTKILSVDEIKDLLVKAILKINILNI